MGQSEKFAREGGCKVKQMRVSLEMRRLPYYNEVFLEIPHDAAQQKNLDMFIFPLLENMC